MSLGQSQTRTNQTENRDPWAPQAPYLLDAFNQAQSQLATSQGNNTYNGPYVAQVDPSQISLFQQMMGYGTLNGTPGGMEATGSGLIDNGTGSLYAANDALTNFAPQGGVDSNIAAATAYANNPAVDGMIDAAMRDARRSVSEQALPQIARSAATSGNEMSSRRAISEGLVQRGLADATADTSANIRGGLFDRGLALAESGRTADNASRLQALLGSGSLSLNTTQAGLSALTDAVRQQGALFDIAGAGGAGLTAAQQAEIDDALQRAFSGDDRAWNDLARYMSIVGGQQWGGQSTGTSTTTQQASPAAIIGGLLGAAGSFMPRR